MILLNQLKMNKVRIAISMSLLIVSLSIVAQTSGVVNESFVIRKNRILSLPKAERSFFPGSLPATSNNDQLIITFDSLEFDTNIDFELPAIKPAYLESAAQKNSISQHLIKIGGGNRLNTLVQYQYLNPINQERRLKFNVSHYGVGVGPVRDEKSAENIQGLDFEVSQSKKHVTARWNTQADRYQFYYYGLPDSSYFDENQLFNRDQNTRVRFANSFAVDYHKNNWRTGLSFGHQLTNYNHENNGENRLFVDGKLTYRLSEKLLLVDKINWTYLSYDTGNKQGRSIFNNSSIARYTLKNWQFEGGFNLYNLDSLSSSDKRFYIIPHLSMVGTLNQKHVVSAGFSSALKDQSLYQLSDRNIYLADSLNMRTSLYKSQWLLSYQYRLSQHHLIEAGASYSSILKQAFFINQANAVNQFQLLLQYFSWNYPACRFLYESCELQVWWFDRREA
jgi:hypothetical protein